MVVEFLSPSKIHFINECKLRYVLSLSDGNRNGSKVFNKYVFLGILMHSVLEHYLISKKQLDIPDYEKIWNDNFNKMILEYDLENDDSDIIKYHLPYYEVKKNKLKLLLKTINYDVPKFDLLLEENIAGGIVRGKADIILDNPAEKKVKIIDFKTGPISSYENGEKQEIKIGYKDQLKTYGYVYWLHGYLPKNIRCALQGISHSEYEEMVFTDMDYQKHEIFLKNLKDDINQNIKNDNDDQLANPSAIGCRFCSHNVKCTTLHNTIASGENFLSLSFIHKSNCSFNDVECRLSIETEKGKISISKIPNDPFRCIKKIIQKGDSVFISGLYEEEHTGVKYWTRYTTYTSID